MRSARDIRLSLYVFGAAGDGCAPCAAVATEKTVNNVNAIKGNDFDNEIIISSLMYNFLFVFDFF